MHSGQKKLFFNASYLLDSNADGQLRLSQTQLSI